MLSLIVACAALGWWCAGGAHAASKTASTKAPEAAPSPAAAAPSAAKGEAAPAGKAGAGGAAAEKGGAKKYYPEGTPTRAIQELDDMLDDFKVAEQGKSLTASEQSFNTSLKQRIIHGTFDIKELARLSLAAHWNGLSEGERSHFAGLLTDLLEEKALFSKEQSAAKSKTGGKYFVVYRGHKFDDPAQAHAFVRTKVVVPAENIDIALNYRLKKTGSEWKIYDIIVDEASLVENYRYQFDSIIKKHGYADLVRRMSEKLTEIRNKRKS